MLPKENDHQHYLFLSWSIEEGSISCSIHRFKLILYLKPLIVSDQVNCHFLPDFHDTWTYLDLIVKDTINLKTIIQKVMFPVFLSVPASIYFLHNGLFRRDWSVSFNNWVTYLQEKYLKEALQGFLNKNFKR